MYRIRMQTYTFSQKSLEELIRNVETWKKRGFHIFAFRPPTSRKMEEIENTKYDEKLVRKAFSAAGGIYLDFPVEAYKTYDASHLTTESAKLFSRDLATKIKLFLDNPKMDKRADGVNTFSPKN